MAEKIHLKITARVGRFIKSEHNRPEIVDNPVNVGRGFLRSFHSFPFPFFFWLTKRVADNEKLD